MPWGNYNHVRHFALIEERASAVKAHRILIACAGRSFNREVLTLFSAVCCVKAGNSTCLRSSHLLLLSRRIGRQRPPSFPWRALAKRLSNFFDEILGWDWEREVPVPRFGRKLRRCSELCVFGHLEGVSWKLLPANSSLATELISHFFPDSFLVVVGRLQSKPHKFSESCELVSVRPHVCTLVRIIDKRHMTSVALKSFELEPFELVGSHLTPPGDDSCCLAQMSAVPEASNWQRMNPVEVSRVHFLCPFHQHVECDGFPDRRMIRRIFVPPLLPFLSTALKDRQRQKVRWAGALVLWVSIQREVCVPRSRVRPFIQTRSGTYPETLFGHSLVWPFRHLSKIQICAERKWGLRDSLASFGFKAASAKA